VAEIKVLDCQEAGLAGLESRPTTASWRNGGFRLFVRPRSVMMMIALIGLPQKRRPLPREFDDPDFQKKTTGKDELRSLAHTARMSLYRGNCLH
jgi:hypothetical protein